MPFAVFRRYQKTMMAALALFAMVAFTLDFSLLRFGRSPGDEFITVSAENTKPISLYGKKIRQSDLNAMMAQRARANRFMALIGAPTQSYFGGLDTRSIIDALILEHMADELKIPADRELAIRWLRQTTDNQLSTELFESTYRQHFSSEVTGEQLLQEIANQLRLAQVRSLPGIPQVTPLDVYQAFRDQNERISARLVPFRVVDYIEQVPMPSEAEIREYFDRYKDAEPDPTRDTPGFKIPKKVAVEFVTADVPARADAIESTLTDEELLAYYRANRDEFFVRDPELPTSLFAGEPDLTPPLPEDIRTLQEFREIRDQVSRRLARRRAEDEVREKFRRIETAALEFSDAYMEATESAGASGATKGAPPEPGDLIKSLAEKEGLEYEKTPMLDRELAENYGRIGAASRGGGPLGGGTSFADEFFAENSPLYTTVTFTDPVGREYLAWKIADQPARVPELSEVKDEVVLAWRTEKARELAEKAARELARKARDLGNDLARAASEEKKETIVTSPTSELMAGLPNPLNPYQSEPARPSVIPEVPDAGTAFRDAYFRLGPTSIEIAPNAPKTVYYVMAREAIQPVSLQTLYNPFEGRRISIQNEVLSDAILQRGQEWMERLRADAGLDPDFVPYEERRSEETRRRS